MNAKSLPSTHSKIALNLLLKSAPFEQHNMRLIYIYLPYLLYGTRQFIILFEIKKIPERTETATICAICANRNHIEFRKCLNSFVLYHCCQGNYAHDFHKIETFYFFLFNDQRVSFYAFKSTKKKRAQ